MAMTYRTYENTLKIIEAVKEGKVTEEIQTLAKSISEADLYDGTSEGIFEADVMLVAEEHMDLTPEQLEKVKENMPTLMDEAIDYDYSNYNSYLADKIKEIL